MALRAWLQSARPLAHANIAIPLLLGEMLAFVDCLRIDWGLLVLAHAFGVLDQLYIVWANDVADEAADEHHPAPTIVSGGSRVLQQGKLRATQIARAAIGAAVVMLALSLVAAVAMDRPATPLFWALAIGLLWAYSFAPLRLSYRGAGGLTQAFGVMVVLPVFGYYLQCGDIRGFVWPALLPCLALGLASNIATALPDFEADTAAEKLTWPVRYGLRRAKTHCVQLIALGAVCTPLVLPTLPKLGWALIEGPALLLAAVNYRTYGQAPADDTRARLRFSLLNGVAINLVIVGWIVALAMQPRWGWPL